MSAATKDPILRSTSARLRVAAGLIARADAEMVAVMRKLKRHPDPLARWIFEGTESTRNDMPFHDAARLLLSDGGDLKAAERRMREDEAREAREEADRAKRHKPSAAA